MNRSSLALVDGLGVFTVDDLCHPAGLTEVVTAKLASLIPGRFVHDRLTQGIRQMLSLIRDAVCGDYRELPLTALADFLKALDYFLRWADRIPDTWEGGYVDDLQEVLLTLAVHQETVAHYEAWRARREAAQSVRMGHSVAPVN